MSRLAVLSLPKRRPPQTQSLRTRFFGGFLPPATDLKKVISSALIGRQYWAFLIASQPSQLGPENHWPNKPGWRIPSTMVSG